MKIDIYVIAKGKI